MAGKKKNESDDPIRRRRQTDTVADWGGIEDAQLKRLICAVTRDGGAIRLGYSRDGGAYNLGIYGDGKPFTEFFPAVGDVDGWLEGIIIDYE